MLFSSLMKQDAIERTDMEKERRLQVCIMFFKQIMDLQFSLITNGGSATGACFSSISSVKKIQRERERLPDELLTGGLLQIRYTDGHAERWRFDLCASIEVKFFFVASMGCRIHALITNRTLLRIQVRDQGNDLNHEHQTIFNLHSEMEYFM